MNLKANSAVYEIRQLNLHHNHEVNEELYKLYAKSRKLNEAEEIEAWEQLKVKTFFSSQHESLRQRIQLLDSIVGKIAISAME